MSKILIAVLLVMVLVLAGCLSAKPFVPPAVCDNADSLILTQINDPRALSTGLLVVQAAALEKVPGYRADDAMVVLSQIEDALDSTPTYLDLVLLIKNKLKIANTLAGAAVFIIGDQIDLLSSPLEISECDKALIRAHLQKQLLLLTVYSTK